MRRSTAVRSCPEGRGGAVHSNGLVAWKLSVRYGGGELESLTHDLLHVSKVCGDMLRSVLLRALDAYWGKTALNGEGHNVAHACQQTRCKMSTPQSRLAPGCPPPTRVQQGKKFLFFAGRAERFDVCCSIGCHAGIDALLAGPHDNRECTSASLSCIRPFGRCPGRGWRKAHPLGGEGGVHGRWQGYRRPSNLPCNDATGIWSDTQRGITVEGSRNIPRSRNTPPSEMRSRFGLGSEDLSAYRVF